MILILRELGLPMPEDVALLAGGFPAHKGVTRYPITLIVALLGVIASDNSLYFIGRGNPLGLAVLRMHTLVQFRACVGLHSRPGALVRY